MNQEKTKQILNDYNLLVQELIKIAKILKPSFEYEQLEIENDNVCFKWERYNYGDWENQYVDFPISYLWTENWQEIEKETFLAEETKKEIEKQEKIKQDKIKKEEQERLTYERLKAKFGQD